MKTFKQYVTEVYGSMDLDVIIFRPIYMAPSYVYLPLSKTMSKRIFGEKSRMLAAHVTSHSGLGDLISVARTQKAVACMTDPGDVSVFTDGIASGGGICAIVEGYPTLISNIDLVSKPGPQGRRYVPLDSLNLDTGSSLTGIEDYDGSMEDEMLEMQRNIHQDVKKLQYKIIMEIVKKANSFKIDSIDVLTALKGADIEKNLGFPWSGVGTSSVVGKKAKGYAIKRWFEEMEKIWKKYLPILNKTILDPKWLVMKEEGWNEIHLVDIRIVEVYIMHHQDDMEDPPSIYGLPLGAIVELSGSYPAMPTGNGIKILKKMQSKVTMK